MSDDPVSIREILERHQRIALDSNILIYLLEADPGRHEVVAAIIDAVATGRVQGVLASIGLAEVLGGPASAGDGIAFEMIAATLRDLGLRVVPVDGDLAEDGAWIRARIGGSLADAIHLAAARAAGATAFITNDRRIRPWAQLDVVYLDDLRVDAPRR